MQALSGFDLTFYVTRKFLVPDQNLEISIISFAVTNSIDAPAKARHQRRQSLTNCQPFGIRLRIRQSISRPSASWRTSSAT
jgi:hypothetical protein